MPDQESSGVDVAKLVAGGFAVVTTATTIVGGLTGGVARFVRNDPDRLDEVLFWTLLAIGVALLASQVRTSAPERPENDKTLGPFKATESRWRWWAGFVKAGLTILSFVFFAFAAWTTADGLAVSVSRPDRPRIAGIWKQYGSGSSSTPVLTVSVKLSGMKAADTLYVRVLPGAAIAKQSNTGALGSVPVYESQTGASVDGDADLSFDVPLPTKWTALQVVASLNEPRACDGKSLPTKAAESSTNPTTTTTVTTPPSTKPYPQVPVKEPNFACMTLAAPVATAVPTPTTQKPG
jgi:hypothetical protein